MEPYSFEQVLAKFFVQVIDDADIDEVHDWLKENGVEDPEPFIHRVEKAAEDE